jgi:NAD(P)H dehydrogenase (quinone)
MKALIVYHTNGGHTKYVAEKIAEGMLSVKDATVKVLSTEEVVRNDLKGIDALLMGSAVQQRNVSWQVKKFIDEICEPSWFFDDLVGRVAGLFTVGGGHGNTGGGAEIAQIALAVNFASLGMILVPHAKTTPGFNKAGMHWGPHIKTSNESMHALQPEELDPGALQAFYHYGITVAKVAKALKGVHVTSLGNDWPNEQMKQARAKLTGIGPIGEPR